jgi:2-methylisocitrate lyase-like PEP mutase family enzyme
MATFSELHGGSSPLVLPNAWDVPSALAFVDAGFAAVGTTSLGVADGDDAPGPTRPQVIGDPPVTPSTSEVM